MRALPRQNLESWIAGLSALGWGALVIGAVSRFHSYEKLLSAKRQGALDEVLKTSLFELEYGSLTGEVARMVDVPNSDDLMEE